MVLRNVSITVKHTSGHRDIASKQLLLKNNATRDGPDIQHRPEIKFCIRMPIRIPNIRPNTEYPTGYTRQDGYQAEIPDRYKYTFLKIGQAGNPVHP